MILVISHHIINVQIEIAGQADNYPLYPTKIKVFELTTKHEFQKNANNFLIIYYRKFSLRNEFGQAKYFTTYNYF